MSNLVDKTKELQAMTCLDALLDRANHDEYLQRIGKKEALRFLEENRQYVEIIKLRLHRLESIDNANPSEAWEIVYNNFDYLISDVGIENDDVNICLKTIKEQLPTIKQALLKAQEPKQYLKWEDLEFNHTPKMFDVKMSGNKYKLVVGYNVAGKNLAILRDGKNEYYFLEYDKQFFNDLHLERVEE